MRPIPPKLRKELAEDESMRRCIYKDCDRTPEWEHAFIYGGRQINEIWALVGCCKYHHREAGLDKNFNQYVSLKKARDYGLFEEVKRKYPRVDWEQKWRYLESKYKLS